MHLCIVRNVAVGVSKSHFTVRMDEPLKLMHRPTMIRPTTSPIGPGLGHFPRTFPPDISPGFSPEVNNVVEIEAGMIKQYFSNRSWIDETIRC